MTAGTSLADIAGGFARDDGGPSPSPLFRPEALAAAADNGLGRPIALLPMSWGVLGGVLAAMVLAFAVFLFTGSFSRKENAIGIVRAVGGELRISAPTPGTVSRVLVNEGQRVRAGDTLFVVDTGRNDVSGRPTDQAMMDSLDRDIAGLETRIGSLEASSAIDLKNGPVRLAALSGEYSAALAQESSASQRLDLAKNAFARMLPIAKKGFISEETVRRRSEDIIVLEQAKAEARGAQARLRGQIAELRSSLDQRPLTLVQERGQLQDQLARAKRDRASYADQRGFAVKAPSDGTVSAMQLTVGQAIDPQRPLMTLDRPGAAVSAEIFVPSRAIAFVELGQQVKIRYDAFSYERFGSATGHIRAISSTVLKPDEVQAAVRVEEPVYRVLVDLDTKDIRAYGRQYHIRPGLALSASIVLDKRSFAAWLLDPIMAMRGRL